jgi:hypothetical protein
MTQTNMEHVSRNQRDVRRRELDYTGLKWMQVVMFIIFNVPTYCCLKTMEAWTRKCVLLWIRIS